MSIFNRDMSIEVLKNGHGILQVPEGITELSGDFALVFDWMPGKMCQYSFREIQLPSSIQKINGIFLTEYGPDEAPIKRFKRITVSEDNPYYADVDGVLFSKDMTRLICYPCGKTGHTYIVPDTVETIGKFAFVDNVNLKKIVLPDSIKRIEEKAFFQCENLSDINLPYGLEYIGEECFALSTNLNRLIVPISLKRIPTSLFYEGSIVSVPNHEIELEYDIVPTEYLNMPFGGPAILSSQNDELVDFAESFDYNHFEDCYEDRNGIIWTNHGNTLVCFPAEWDSDEYELPDEVSEVYIGAFRGCSLKRFHSCHQIKIVGRKVDMPKYYEPMSGRYFHITAFEIFCDDSKDLNKENVIQDNDSPHFSADRQNTPLGDTLEEEEAKKLCVDENGHIDIPHYIKTIGAHAFNCRKDIVSVTLPEGLRTISDSAFNACHNLAEINIPQSVVSIEDDAFARCFKIDNIKLPESIECIHSGTFQHCSNLKHITVPAALKTIDRIAFWYCYKLTEICLPDTLNYIFDDAFDGCNDLSIIAPVDSFAQSFAVEHGFLKDAVALKKSRSENTKESNAMGYAFISYSSKNQQMAESFKTLFNQNNIATWMAPGDIPFGSTYTSTINSAIREASCFVLLLSESAQGSQWVLRETERAVSTGKTIFTVLLDDVPMNDDFEFMLSTSQAVAIRKIDTNDENIQRLLKTVKVYTNGIENEAHPQRQESENTSVDGRVNYGDDIILNESCDPELVIEDGVLTEYKGNAEYVVVPDGVTAIGDCVFWQNESLREIHLPEGVAHIGDAAFCACKNLETINFPKSLLYIGKDAFFACKKLNRIDLPNNLTTISENAFGFCINIRNLHIPKRLRQLSSDSFHGCTKLETITLDDESEAFDLYDGCLYDILMKKLYIVPGTKKSVTFPDDIKEIGRAFSGNDQIETILLPDSIESIERGAFSDCANLKSISLGENIHSIGTHAFSNCESLMSITVSAENPIYRSENNCCIRRIDNVLLFGCMNSIIPDGITAIADAAFYGCSWLTDIDLPDSIIKIGKSAFYESGLTRVAIPEHVESIDNCAFDNCDALTYIIIPNSVKYIGNRAFTGSDYTFEERYIFCEAGQKPERWNREWTDDDSNVYWKDEWNYDESGNPVVQ